MKIRIIKLAVVKGCPGVKPGDVVEVHAAVGNEAISLGVAENADNIVVTREPAVETRDPEVEHTAIRKGRKKLF